MKLEIDITIRDGRDAFLAELSGIVGKLEALVNLKKENQKHMALTTSEQALVDRFNAATSAIAQKIKDLIAAGNTDSPEFLANLGTIADGLDALGQPGTPVPGPGPQPQP